MNTIVREMNPAEEIELADAQLAAVYGAWGEECQPECQPERQPECGCGDDAFSKKFEKEVKVHIEFEFEFDAEFKQKQEQGFR